MIWNQRKHRRRVLVLVVGAAVLAALVGATDLLVGHRAEQRVAAQARRRLKPDGPVRVDLTTPLAGLRTLGGHLGDVRVSADGVHREQTVMDVTARLNDVTTHGTSAGGTGTATVGYDQVARRTGARADGLTATGRDGDLVLEGPVGNLGLPVTVRAELTTTAHSLTVTPTTVSVLGRTTPVRDLTDLPSGSPLREALRPRTLPVTGLPHGIALTSAHAADDGLALAFSVAPGPTPGGKATSATP
ncbi:LmeA family phospholipid-binding protein [Streptomyces mangrovisoli]|uniref:DUF2993 domain-containing protein n=1 Tax=Streptomyces mangrovisoli TaxID=1428628 RepID=A0A1J4NJR3_9ACTN|nr:LmeA family phospholipid-binding protein [Streptomyces mangrovisoli]OIJ62617.1 hypothetical protein WN71_038555 [Streptomyces mangrovisoli]